jgi:hypothetical protein
MVGFFSWLLLLPMKQFFFGMEAGFIRFRIVTFLFVTDKFIEYSVTQTGSTAKIP